MLNNILVCNIVSIFDISLRSERMFGKNWREVRLVLHEDSTLAWYLSDSDQEGGILLKDSPEMIAAGQVKNYW
jgi:hypothetical protein